MPSKPVSAGLLRAARGRESVTVQTASPEEHPTEGPRLPITLPMMGTCRRDCEQRNLTSIAALSRLRALLASTQPHSSAPVSLGELSASLQAGDGKAAHSGRRCRGGRGANVPANICGRLLLHVRPSVRAASPSVTLHYLITANRYKQKCQKGKAGKAPGEDAFYLRLTLYPPYAIMAFFGLGHYYL